jgi:hypothetical protein
VRLYSASSEETLRARQLLTDWAGEGYLARKQYQRLEQETVHGLRTTNIFLRMVLFLFTLISVGAAVALFFKIFLPRPSEQTFGVFLLIFAAVCYAAAEGAVSKAHLYRYGIEEALAVYSVGFLCVGLQAALFSGIPHLAKPSFRYGYGSASGFGMHSPPRWSLVLFLPGYWTLSHPAQHLIVAGFYATGLICVAAMHSRHRFDYLDEDYSLVEAFLWLGIYLAINLRLSSLNLAAQWWGGSHGASEFAKPFYWTTWVMIWCLPPIVLALGVRQKDRFAIAVGAIVAILTVVTNKPYLGWQRHTWDPMLLGILLTAVAIFIRRWLTRGPGGIRHGFTAERLSGKDKHWIDVGSTVFGLLSPQSITPAPQTSGKDFRFGGGESGGGGASGDF